MKNFGMHFIVLKVLILSSLMLLIRKVFKHETYYSRDKIFNWMLGKEENLDPVIRKFHMYFHDG